MARSWLGRSAIVQAKVGLLLELLLKVQSPIRAYYSKYNYVQTAIALQMFTTNIIIIPAGSERRAGLGLGGSLSFAPR